MTKRIRPTAQDQRDAADLRWLDEHAERFYHLKDRDWIVYGEDYWGGEGYHVSGIHKAIAKARELADEESLSTPASAEADGSADASDGGGRG